MDLESMLANQNVPIEDILVEVKRRDGIHEINQTRSLYGQYHTLFHILKKYPRRFKSYTRMTLTTFLLILCHIQDDLKKNWCNLRDPIYPEEQLVVTLRFLITGCSYNDLAISFRMGVSTVCNMVKKVMTVVWDKLQPIYMAKPSQSDFLRISRGFYRRWDFPHCVGAIDCRHIAVKKPAHSKSLYYNYKQFHSIKLQAVVDAYYRFIFIEVGDFGSCHDSTTFKNSTLYACLKSGVVKLPQDSRLPRSGIILPYYFIGDGAYMLQENLMKPFRKGNNYTFEKKYFNKRLSSARGVVECAFGHITRMFKILKKTMELTPQTAALVTKCTCLLRNIIIDEEGETVEMAVQPNNISPRENTLIGGDDDSESESEFVVGLGKEVRDELNKYLMEHPN